MVSLTSWEAAKEILKDNDLTFAKWPALPILEMMIFEHAEIILSPYSDYWRRVRKICIMELLILARVKSFRPVREWESRRLVESIGDAFGMCFNLKEKMFACPNSIVLKATFGRTCKRQGGYLSALAEHMRFCGPSLFADIFPFL